MVPVTPVLAALKAHGTFTEGFLSVLLFPQVARVLWKARSCHTELRSTEGCPGSGEGWQERTRLIHRVLAVGMSTHDTHVTRIQTVPAPSRACCWHLVLHGCTDVTAQQQNSLLRLRAFHPDYYKWITGCITMPLVINTLLFNIRFVLLSCEPLFAW